MPHILISGLDGQGPGDILGAVDGETNLDPQLVGNIKINNSQALVEIDEDHAEELAKQLDGRQVGHASISAKTVGDDELQRREAIRDYSERFERLVEMEREEEMREHDESIRKLTGRQREAEGKAILHLRGRDEGQALEGQLVKFMRQQKDEELPETEITVGDLVMISRDDPLRDDNPTGTVVQKTNYSITAAFDHPQDFIFGNGLRMDLYVNDITYQRMKDALGHLQQAEEGTRLAELRDILTRIKAPTKATPVEIDSWLNGDLNESQKEAVAYSLGSEDFYLVHGPPGTGKTTTAIEVIEQAVADGQTVLATAASNAAVDNILEFLLERGIKAVRVGHPARVTPMLREQTLDNLVTQTEAYQTSEMMRDQAFAKKDEQEDYTHPSGRYRRGMSDSRIRQLARQNQGARGVSADKIQDMARWLDLQEEVDELFEKADQLRQQAINQILDNKQVVCTTNSTAGSELMKGRAFDLVVIDEATQATEPSCLIPITHADKVVMAGDHQQLPPTVKNFQAARMGLEETLFERLAEAHPEIKKMLKLQYRMHEKIMDFSSSEFYDGELEAHESVGSHTLVDFRLDINAFDSKLMPILDPAEPVTFVDTAETDAEERTRMGSTSKVNQKEAELVTRLTENLIKAGMKAEEIAVISPYNDQVDLLQQQIDAENLEVKSVDGFQGREKEVVIISLVRSNPENEIGFLEDVRRLNVSLTRARRKLIVIGDSSTITTHDTYQHFMDFVRDYGSVIEW